MELEARLRHPPATLIVLIRSRVVRGSCDSSSAGCLQDSFSALTLSTSFSSSFSIPVQESAYASEDSSEATCFLRTINDHSARSSDRAEIFGTFRLHSHRRFFIMLLLFGKVLEKSFDVLKSHGDVSLMQCRIHAWFVRLSRSDHTG